jgi:hypothetical protein
MIPPFPIVGELPEGTERAGRQALRENIQQRKKLKHTFTHKSKPLFALSKLSPSMGLIGMRALSPTSFLPKDATH